MISLSDDQIKEISQELECGFECFINKRTGACIRYPSDYQMDDTGAWDDLVKEVKDHRNQYIHISPPSGRESFRIMENFVRSLNERDHVRAKLAAALSRPKPFSNFKYVIDNSGNYRQLWFTFKNKEFENIVRQQLKDAANET